MRMDVLNLGTDETQVRYTLNRQECETLMEACASLRELRFPGVLDKMPQMFDEADLVKAMGAKSDAQAVLELIDLEQAFHQALHMFPGGHSHGDEDHGH
ncbi:MAG: hypothetical protein VKP62_01475 [Candidatus Sericytochromatia bacterium]|nr:hypothetical protein [Candidatus Sericytochromatia bacterium]